jgi:N-acetylglucosamine-6-phosphate deacetylase
MIAHTAAALLTPLERVEQPVVLVDDGVIVKIAAREEFAAPGCRLVDLGDAILAPAFVDLHIHGASGHDVMASDAGALPAIERFLFEHGVGSYFPTTVTAPIDTTLVALERLAGAIEAARKDPARQRARPLGIHLEGPFISHVRRGVHPPQDLLPPSVKVFERLWQAARGHVGMMTIAPELEGALEVIHAATARGVRVSVGHSDADLNATRAAVAAGARHATHTFNAMRPLGHRDPGIAGVVLTDSRLTADIIADGIHVDPVVVKLFLQAKGRDGAVLITDSTAAAGMPDGKYRLGSFEVQVRGGKCTLDGKLAGSVLTMDDAVRNVMQFAGWSMQDAVRLATLNAAKACGVPGGGVLAPGSAADMVVLDPSGAVKKTIIGGAGV